MGKVHVLLWTDESVQAIEKSAPKFPLSERLYFAEAIRYVDRASPVEVTSRNSLPAEMIEQGATWVVEASQDNAAQEAFCREHGLKYSVISAEQLQGYPEPDVVVGSSASTGRKKVIVTGCYDWFHSGHVRFFEEVSELGELHVVVGHDANIELLKGKGHPMYKEDLRRYMAGSIRFVHRAYISSGSGWLDAEPEIERIKPDIYAVNEDGDVPEKTRVL